MFNTDINRNDNVGFSLFSGVYEGKYMCNIVSLIPIIFVFSFVNLENSSLSTDKSSDKFIVFSFVNSENSEKPTLSFRFISVFV